MDDKRPLRVAIAEDDDELRETFATALGDLGFDVLSFEDGFELLDYVELGGGRVAWPDAVVADVHMPGRSGLEALEVARARGMAGPIVVVTGDFSESVRRRTEALGRAVALPKPSSAEQLAGAIGALMPR